MADTKTYLTVDPGGLWNSARYLWDPAWGLGVVPHQNIGYLWPMGPWFWFFETIGFPDWVAQRLFLGTALFAAGAGVMFLAKVWGWDHRAGTVAGFVYALSPYPLSYATRLSALILPWAGFGWLLALLILTARHGGWRRPATFALVTMTVGGVNASSLMYVGFGVILWLPFGVMVERDISWRQAWTAVWRIGALTTITSLWWLAGLVVQGSFGAPILQYSETTETVASGSNSAEAFRGLGYWIFYGGDRIGPWVGAGVDYAENLALIAVGFVLPVVALSSLAIVRWRQKAYLMMLMIIGIVLTTGVHPFADPSPLAGWFNNAFGDASFGLAVRSSPRSLPLFLLGLAGTVGFTVSPMAERFHEWRTADRTSDQDERVGTTDLALERRRLSAALLVLLVAAAGVPALWTGRYVGGELARDEALPQYWIDVAQYLDDSDDGTRTMTFPGNDFSAHRWGNTIDHVLPGLTDRETAIRELIAYASDPASDLLIALDRRLQEGVADWETISRVAARMGVGELVVQLDLEYERFRTPRPDDLWAQIGAPSVSGAGFEVFDSPEPNIASEAFPLLDERELVFARADGEVPAVVVAHVEDATALIRLESLSNVVVVAGSGEGLVDLVGMGIVGPDDLVLYESTTPDWLLDEVVARGARLILTDSERLQARRWKTVRDNLGFTERADGADALVDASDARLDLPAQVGAEIADASTEFRTTARQVGATVLATDYGNIISYHPENRPIAAIDGNPFTSWRTGAFGAPVTDIWSVSFEEPIQADQIVLLQPTTGERERFITAVDVSINGAGPMRVVLGPESRQVPGQVVPFGAEINSDGGVVAVSTVDLTVAGLSVGSSPVGFAEVVVGDGSTIVEQIVLPTRLLDRAGQGRSTTPDADILLTRLRTDPTNLVREDTEARLVRSVDVTAGAFELSGDARLSPRADSGQIDAHVLAPGSARVTATSVLDGPPAHLPSRAADGDPSTFWLSEFGPQVGQVLTLVGSAGSFEGAASTMTFVVDGRHSVPTSIGVSINGGAMVEVAVPELAAGADSAPDSTMLVDVPWLGADADVSAIERVDFTILAVDEHITVDWFSAQDVVAPIGIAEVGVKAVSYRASLDGGCRSDLLLVNGRPVSVRLLGPAASRGWLTSAERGLYDGSSLKALTLGQPLTVEGCETIEHAGGPLVIEAADGRLTGIDLDRLFLSGLPQPSDGVDDSADLPGAQPAAVRLVSESQTSRRIAVSARDEPMLLVLNDSFSVGWRLRAVDGELPATRPGLDEPLLVDGHANAWWLPAGEAVVLEMVWVPQRLVDIALLLSVFGVVLCLGLVVFVRRDRATSILQPTAVTASSTGTGLYAATDSNAGDDVLRGADQSIGWRPGVIESAGVGVVVGLLTRPYFGIGVGLVTLVLGRLGKRRWLAIGAAAFVALAGCYELYLVGRYGVAHSGSWPLDMARAHELAWVGLGLLMATAMHELRRG